MSNELNSLEKIESLNLIGRRYTQNSMGGGLRPNDVSNIEVSKEFWGDIWSSRKEHNQEVEWQK